MKELTKFQKKLLNEFTATKKVHFQYDVVDCEHNGDVLSAIHRVENFINPYKGEVVDSYWDGRDCGEAWVECVVPYEATEEILKKGFFFYDPWQD